MGAAADMFSMNDFGLCGGSLAGADFRTLVECAGDSGFRFVTLWPSHFDDALASGLTVADMRAILSDNGVSVSELDPFCAWLPVDAEDGGIAAHFYEYDESDFFRIADSIGARSLNVVQFGGESIARTEVADTLGALCARASGHGLIVSVEFMAWSPIHDLASALELVRATDRSDCGVNLDVWHHHRTGGTVADLAGLDASEVAAVQLSDLEPEPWDDVLQETARARRLPGDGTGTNGDVLEALRRIGVRVPINVEVFSDELRQWPPAQAASTIAQKVNALLEGRR